jgi:hypothetical protein
MLMKKKRQFFKDCGIGSGIALVLLFGTIMISRARGIGGYINPLSFVFPLLFIPLLVSVFHDKRYNCVEIKGKKKSSEIPFYKKDTCILVIGTMLTITLIVSMIVLYYGW